MVPNVVELRKLVDNNFRGNQTAFGKAIGIDRAQVSKILKDGTNAGALFFGALLAYCEKEGLDFRQYILLTKRSKSKRIKKVKAFK
jgi:hypothetical protein